VLRARDQLRAVERGRVAQRHTGIRLRELIADRERRIKLQVQALEDGIEPAIVTARITELRADITAAEADLAELDPAEAAAETDDLTERLARIPNLAQQLRDAPRDIQRQTYEAFDLRIEFDKVANALSVSASVTEAVAQAFEDTKALQEGGLPVTVSDIAGGGIRTLALRPVVAL